MALYFYILHYLSVFLENYQLRPLRYLAMITSSQPPMITRKQPLVIIKF